MATVKVSNRVSLLSILSIVVLLTSWVIYSSRRPGNQERQQQFSGGLRISADIPEEKVGLYGNNQEAPAMVFVWVKSLNKNNFVFSQTLNVSEDGLKAEAELPLDPGFYFVDLRYYQNLHSSQLSQQQIYTSTIRKVRVPREGATWIELHYQKQENKILTDKEMSELREEEKKQEAREETLEGLKKDLDVLKGQKRRGDFGEEKLIPSWELTIRYGQRMAKAISICEAYQRFMSGRHLISALRGENTFTTETIGTSWTEPLSLERKNSLDTARGLLSMLKSPVEGVSCGRSEGQFYVDNQDEMIERLVEVMNSAGLQPRDIGTTPIKIREIIRKRVKKEISKLTPQLKGSNAAWAGGRINIFLKDYKFTPKEVGLTRVDLGLIEKVKKSQK